MKIGINGFGMIGQALLQQSLSSDDVEIVAINEIGLSLLDAVEFLGEAASVTDSGDLSYVGRTIKWLALADHRKIGWEQYGVQVVVEASCLFLRKEMEEQSAGGQVTILMTGDLRDEPPDLTLVLGINDSQYRPGMSILCAGSDRTQSLVPILHAIHERFGVTSYRTCLHRPPYTGVCGRVQNRPGNAEELARVLPALSGRGELVRVDDPEADFVTAWLDVTVEKLAEEGDVREALDELAARLPDVVLCSTQLPSPVGDRHSALVDASSVRTEWFGPDSGGRIWLKLFYDPVVSYAERIREQLKFVRGAGRPRAASC